MSDLTEGQGVPATETDQPLGAEGTPAQPAENEQKFTVDFSETSEAVKQLADGVKEKSEISEKGVEKTTAPKYKAEKDYLGDPVWTDTTTGEHFYDEPDDVDAVIEAPGDEAQKIFDAAIAEADKRIAGSRQAAVDAAQKALESVAEQAFGTLDEDKRKMLVADVLNSQMPGIVGAIDSGQEINWDAVSAGVANEIEQRVELYNLREQEQVKIDADKWANFPLETQSLTGVQGFEGANSRINATRAQDENFIQQLANKYKTLFRGK